MILKKNNLKIFKFNKKLKFFSNNSNNHINNINPRWLIDSEVSQNKIIINSNFSNYCKNFLVENLLSTPNKEVSYFNFRYENSKKYFFGKKLINKKNKNFYNNYIMNDNSARLKWFKYFSFEKGKRAKEIYYGYGDHITRFFNISLDRPMLLNDCVLLKKRKTIQFIKLLNSNIVKLKNEKKIFLQKDLKKLKNSRSINSIIDNSFIKTRFKKLFHKKIRRKEIKIIKNTTEFPINFWVKKTSDIEHLRFNSKFSYTSILYYQQSRRHPNSQSIAIQKIIKIGSNMDSFLFSEKDKETSFDFSRFFKAYWKFFKFKMEKFFFSQMTTRVHVWFLNIWDVFLNSVDAVWRWFRYENKSIFYLTRKGQRFFIEDREDAKFYIRSLALCITTVGGAKLFMDKISLMMKQYRNNWSFILHTVKSLRVCVNYFWFRFFINYKVTLQGKIGGYLRAQKKFFKKGNISIESKECAITYYRGFPVTRFGSYNLSFWLQYRIPNLIEKFGESEYIDTMKILLSMYSVPWLASRLSEIIKRMLLDRVYVVNRKLAQYERRKRARLTLVYDILKIKKYHFKNTTLKFGSEHKFEKLKNIVLKRKLSLKPLTKSKISITKALVKRFKKISKIKKNKVSHNYNIYDKTRSEKNKYNKN